MSTFPPRRAPIVLRRRGTRPWLNGLTLTSCGHRELDSVLGGSPGLGSTGSGSGGGLCIGSTTLVCEDRLSGFGGDVGLYFVAEGISQKQQVLLPFVASSPDSITEESNLRSFLSRLPRNLHVARSSRRMEKAASADLETSMDSIIDDLPDDDDDGQAVDGSFGGGPPVPSFPGTMRRRRPGKDDAPFCHSYDLSAPMQSALLSAHPPILADCTPPPSCPDPAAAFFRRLVGHVRAALDTPGGTRGALRVYLRDVDPALLSPILPLLVAHVRSYDLPVVVVASVRPHNHPPGCPLLVSLMRGAGAVFTVESFAGRRGRPPAEFAEYDAILHVPRIGAGWGGFGCKTNRPSRYGMKRDGRKLAVSMLHLPPEDGGGSVGSGPRSGGGKQTGENNRGGGARMGSCGASLGSKGSLDF